MNHLGASDHAGAHRADLAWGQWCLGGQPLGVHLVPAPVLDSGKPLLSLHCSCLLENRSATRESQTLGSCEMSIKSIQVSRLHKTKLLPTRFISLYLICLKLLLKDSLPLHSTSAPRQCKLQGLAQAWHTAVFHQYLLNE